MSSPITDFAGRVVVITGGASGIGLALATAFVAENAHVVIADIEKDPLHAAAERLSGGATHEVTGIVVDVSDSDSVEALAAAVFERFGAVHVLINNAGVGAPASPVWDTTPNDWRWTFGVNVFGVAFGVQSFVPRMIASGEPGYVVNTSSGDGAVTPMPNASVYAASKAAVGTITECLAVNLQTAGAPIAASLFLPAGNGLLDTGLWTADRNRPDALARERPRSTPATTIAALRANAAKAGHEIPLQPLDELAQVVLSGIKEGTYCLTIGLADDAATLHERADRFGRGEVPSVLEHFSLNV
jgi:NAD(P)-dependent dehydrogenase (short-subunit alcohol dehydrogenase family)